MFKFPNISEESAAMQRRETLDERPQDRYADRLKFEFCRWCGSQDGMQSVHREVLAEMPEVVITLLVSWYSEPGNAESLFYPCHTCNPARIVPLVYDPMTLDGVRVWVEEPVLASEDSRDGAGV